MRIIDNIFVPDDVYGDLGIGPELVEVVPHSYVLLNELSPKLWEGVEIIVVNWTIVWTGADHVEQRGDWVNRVSYQKYSSLGIELGFSISFWIVCFDNHDSFIDEAFTSETHEH